MPKRTVRLPAITVEVPRMGLIVYVSDKTGIEEGKHSCMFTAEIVVKGNMELQSFHVRCKNKKEAIKMMQDFSQRLRTKGPFPFIQHDLK